MVAPISLMAATKSLVAACMPAICVPISSVALAVCVASAFTSEATTAKPRAGLAGARRLDRGVERQQVGLLGDGGDQLDHVADAAGRLRQLVDAAVGLLRLLDRLAGDPARLLHLPADLADRGGQLLGRGCDRLDVVRRLLRGAGHHGGELLGGLGGLRQRRGRRLQLGRRRRDGRDDVADRRLELVGDSASPPCAARPPPSASFCSVSSVRCAQIGAEDFAARAARRSRRRARRSAPRCRASDCRAPPSYR